jgi:lipopolysaccharide cholinephosphotransferase
VTPVSLDELRRLQRGILLEVDRVCRAEGIVYYLAYGTLLGAVRHGGFIPWDDDVDVMLPRADYERFLDRFAAVAPEHLSVGCPATQAAWPLPYAKVSDDRTQLWEPLEVPVALGVNIDVFPVDRLPVSRVRRRWQAVVLRMLLWALELRYITVQRGRGWHSAFAIRVVKPALRLVPVQRLVAAVTRRALGSGRYSSGDAARAGVRVGSYDWSVPAASLGEPTELSFEGVRCLAPRDPDRVLTALYGDYRRLPPEDRRVSEHAFRAAWREPRP